MKIKHTFTLFCVTLTLAFLLVSCADTQGNGDGGDNLTPAKVSAENCAVVEPELNCFISVWNTANSGTGASDSTNVVLPLVSDGTYDFYVNWGDDSDVEKIEAYNAPKVTHSYDEPGTYTVYIAGTIKGWRFYVEDDNYGDAVKLLDITQWGSLSLGNTAGGQFYRAEKFNPTATDAPDVSETTDLSYAFNIASSFNADISDWDVSKVTNMSYMFSGATSFNNNGMGLDWDDKTSKVTDMGFMFWGASVFNQDICYWNVGNVTQPASVGFANVSALENKNNPFEAECTARKSN